MFAEANPFSDSTGNYMGQVEYLAQALEALPASGEGHVSQMDATSASEPMGALVMTDPPYYDNVPYSDLADFFYVWLRSAGSSLYPDLFATLLTPKAQELIAEPARTGDWASAAAFFEEGLGKVFRRIAGLQNPEYPFCLFYAFKQAERSVADGSIASTGWEAMLQALLDAGFSIDGTWPVRTEATGGLRELGRNALASSIVLVCRPRSHDLLVGTRKEFVAALRAELPPALQLLQQANIAPVDLAQAAIGPGMATFSRFSRVIDAEGRSLNVRAVLSLVNEVLDEIMAEQEGEVDPLTRWAIAWFEQFGFASGSFGVAETLSKAKNTSLGALEECGIAHSAAGSVRLLPVSALREDWDPNSAKRLTAWQATHQLCRSLETGGEAAASMLLRQLGGLGEPSRALAYRLYLVCDRKKWTKEALAYNSLVVAWPDLVRTYKAEAALPVQQEMRTN
jgi:putative DNA methylase